MAAESAQRLKDANGQAAGAVGGDQDRAPSIANALLVSASYGKRSRFSSAPRPLTSVPDQRGQGIHQPETRSRNRWSRPGVHGQRLLAFGGRQRFLPGELRFQYGDIGIGNVRLTLGQTRSQDLRIDLQREDEPRRTPSRRDGEKTLAQAALQKGRVHNHRKTRRQNAGREGFQAAEGLFAGLGAIQAGGRGVIFQDDPRIDPRIVRRAGNRHSAKV